MPLRKDRDFPVSQYHATIVLGEQSLGLIPLRKKVETPNERTIEEVLQTLYQLTGFTPPEQSEAGAVDKDNEAASDA